MSSITPLFQTIPFTSTHLYEQKFNLTALSSDLSTFSHSSILAQFLNSQPSFQTTQPTTTPTSTL